MQYALYGYVEDLGEWLPEDIFDTLPEADAARLAAIDPDCSPESFFAIVMIDGTAKDLMAKAAALGYTPLS